MNTPSDLLYSTDHEWVRQDGDIATIGITDFAQDSLGDVVFVEAPPVGEKVARGDSSGEIESTKSVSDLYAPVSGDVAEVNDALEESPELVNSDPYGEGWIYKIEMSDVGELEHLMDADAYLKFTEG